MKAKAAYHDLIRRDAIALLPQPAGRVLDFGGGVGATAAALRNCGQASRAVLFDQVAEHALAGIDDAVSLDFEDSAALAAMLGQHGPFDTILCLDILEHLRDPWSTVALLEEALAPGGQLLISVPNVACYTIMLPLLMRDRFEYRERGMLDRSHLRWFTRRSAIELGRGRALAVQQVTFSPLRRRDVWINRLTGGLFKRFIVHQHLVLSRKPA